MTEPNRPTAARRFVDLHTHSCYSDGTYTPAELVHQADQADLAAVALTDHDTIAGVWEAQRAAAEHPGLHFLAGVEISAKRPVGVLHILGLGIDPSSTVLGRVLKDLRDARDLRNPKIIDRLRRMGVRIGMDDVLAAAQRLGPDTDDRPCVVGRLHIAQAMINAGYVRTVEEAFAKYLGSEAPAYVDKEKLTAREAIDAIHAAGGLAILAHPVQLGCRNRAELEQTVKDLVGAGLDGLEAYHTDHTPQQTRIYLDIARRAGLCVTGGSDFHGRAKPQAMLGRPRVTLGMVAEARVADLLGLG